MPGRPSDNPALVLAWTVDRPRAIAFLSKHLATTGGNLKATAEAVGISRRALTRWVASDKQLAAIVTRARALILT